jgi:hypothetical protein
MRPRMRLRGPAPSRHHLKPHILWSLCVDTQKRFSYTPSIKTPRAPQDEEKGKTAMKIWTTLLMVVALWMVFVSPGRCATDLPILLPLAQQQITEEFGRLDGGLKGAAEQLRVTGLTGEKARAILNNLCGDFSYAVDARNRMVAVEPVPFRYLEESDISWQEQVIRRAKEPQACAERRVSVGRRL